ncbi:MAG: hypothetical protein K5894_12310 [Lachnospiraceae bacterium]|nr:hypothetical protein [Lachnospiraceae bacterium]
MTGRKTNVNYLEMLATKVRGDNILSHIDAGPLFNWSDGVASEGCMVINQANEWIRFGTDGSSVPFIPRGWHVLGSDPAVEATHDIMLPEGISAGLVFDDGESYSVDFAPNGRTVTLETATGYDYDGGFVVTDADQQESC